MTEHGKDHAHSCSSNAISGLCSCVDIVHDQQNTQNMIEYGMLMSLQDLAAAHAHNDTTAHKEGPLFSGLGLVSSVKRIDACTELPMQF